MNVYTPTTSKPIESFILKTPNTWMLVKKIIEFPHLQSIAIAIVAFIVILYLAHIFLTIVKKELLAISFPKVIKKIFPNQIFEETKTIILKDGTTLKGASLVINTFKNKANKKILLLLNGNDLPASSAFLRTWKNTHQAFNNSDALSMNYRGTFNSEGKFSSHKQYVQDGEEIVDHLLSEGYSPHNIQLIGYSFGGSIAPEVFTHINKKCSTTNKYPSLILYHTFHRLDTGASHIYNNPISRCIVKSFTKLALLILGWDYHFNKNILDEQKGRIFVIGGGDSDTDMPHPLELTRYLKQTSCKQEGIIIDKNRHTTIDLSCINNNAL